MAFPILVPSVLSEYIFFTAANCGIAYSNFECRSQEDGKVESCQNSDPLLFLFWRCFESSVIEDDQSVFRGGIESEVRGQRHRIQTETLHRQTAYHG